MDWPALAKGKRKKGGGTFYDGDGYAPRLSSISKGKKRRKKVRNGCLRSRRKRNA